MKNLWDDNLKRKKRALTYCLAAWACTAAFFLPHKSHADLVNGQISTIGDATHLEFTGRENWNYDLNRVGDKSVHLVIPQLSTEAQESLLRWQGRFIEKIRIGEAASDGRVQIEFVLKEKDVESFDYLTDEPSRLIVDFFKEIKKEPIPQDLPEKQAGGEEKPKASKVASARSSTPEIKDGYEKKNKQRKPAGSEILVIEKTEKDDDGIKYKHGVFDAADPQYERFTIKDYQVKEEAVIASRQKIYIRFPMLKMRTSRLKEWLNRKPEYKIRARDDKENKEARLLLTLYKKKRWATFLKTYKYFMEQYKDSYYDEMMRYLAADVYYELWLRDGKLSDYQQAKNQYSYLINKYPDSPLKERAQLIINYTDLERGKGLESIQSFQDFLRDYPDSESRDRARFALADSYLILSKFKGALNTYKDIQADFGQRSSAIEAQYREGDVYFTSGDFSSAVKSYKASMKEHPHSVGRYPNALYNTAESLFWLGEYKESLEYYLKFLRTYPSHDHGGYAMTRVGELLEILGAERNLVMGAFLESHFRFRDSQGAAIARIRMLSQKMKGMKKKELDATIEEMKKYSESLTLPKIGEFVNLMIANGFSKRGDYKKALDTLISYYQTHPTSTNLSFFRQRIHGNMSDYIKETLENNDFLGALKIFSTYESTWLKNTERIDVDYFLANAYEQAGVFKEAEKGYKLALKRVKSIEGTREEKERKVYEHLPSTESLNLRLASVMVSQRRFPEAYEYLKNAKDSSQLQPRELVERVALLAKISEERGHLEAAKTSLVSLTEAWRGDPKLLYKAHYRLARLNKMTGDHIQALKSLEYLENQKASAKATHPPTFWEKVMRLKGDVYLEQGNEIAAVETYMKLIEQSESQGSMADLRFKSGRILFEEGDLKGAERIWSGLDRQKDYMYWRLADEKMRQASWEDDYKKYLKRMPAATKF